MLITAKFNNIEFLKKGNLVLLKGRPIGYVVAVYKTQESLMVDMDIEGDTKIASDATAVIAELSLMGGRTISINFEKECEQDCLQSGAVIPGTVYTMKEQVEAAAGPMLEKVGRVIDTLTSPSGIDAMLQQAQESVKGLATTTDGFNKKMRKMAASLPGSVRSFRSMTDAMLSSKALQDNLKAAIDNQNALASFDTLVSNLAALSPEDIESMTQLLYTAAEQLDKLPDYIIRSNKLLAKADTVLDDFNATFLKYQAGQKGQIAKMLHQKSYKDSLNSSIQKISETLLGVRNHPEDYLSLKKK